MTILKDLIRIDGFLSAYLRASATPPQPSGVVTSNPFAVNDPAIVEKLTIAFKREENPPIIQHYISNTTFPVAHRDGGYFIDYLFIHFHNGKYRAMEDSRYNTDGKDEEKDDMCVSRDSLDELLTLINDRTTRDNNVARLKLCTDASVCEQNYVINPALSAYRNKNAQYRKKVPFYTQVQLKHFKMYTWNSNQPNPHIWSCIVYAAVDVPKHKTKVRPVGRLTRTDNGQSSWRNLKGLPTTDTKIQIAADYVTLTIDGLRESVAQILDWEVIDTLKAAAITKLDKDVKEGKADTD